MVARVAAAFADAPMVEPRTALGVDVFGDVDQEARWLVAGVLGVTPAQLHHQASSSATLSADALESVERALLRRLRGEPLAYVLGTAAFRHLELAVDSRVLIPRPETECLVDEVLTLTAGRPGGVAVDIGTGSGALALSLATEGAFAHIIATDISADALAVARDNAVRVQAHGRDMAPVEFRLGADLAPLEGVQARVIVANPPYIAYEEAAALPASVRDWEPPTALFAADEGMARYMALFAGGAFVLEPEGWIVCEVDVRRAGRTAMLAESQGFRQVQLRPDLTGRDRLLLAQRPI